MAPLGLPEQSCKQGEITYLKFMKEIFISKSCTSTLFTFTQDHFDKATTLLYMQEMLNTQHFSTKSSECFFDLLDLYQKIYLMIKHSLVRAACRNKFVFSVTLYMPGIQ